jgi:hypothetical protein
MALDTDAEGEHIYDEGGLQDQLRICEAQAHPKLGITNP